MSLGKNIPHDSAFGHVTGQSIYIDDRPLTSGELQILILGSPVAAGRLKNIDFSDAVSVPGVVAIFTARDLHHNRWGTFVEDQPFLVEDEIGHRDEPVCILVGQNLSCLVEAKKRIRLQIEEKQPLFTIDEAIQAKQFLYHASPIIRGTADLAIQNSPHRLAGSFQVGGQEHFYMESQASVVYPTENGGLEVHSSSQHPTEAQHLVAHALGLPFHKVTCIVKRMGGGFGGKESQAGPFAALAALAAHRLKKPVRIILNKDDDMKMTGKRHPFKNFYEVGFDEEGRILGIQVKLFSDGGAYADLSSSVLERAMFHIDGAYYLPQVKIEGTVCKTNLQSNTAFRGFGAPQGTLTIESILEDIARFLGKDAFEVRRINCYGSVLQEKDGISFGDPSRLEAHYGQRVEGNRLPTLFDEIYRSAEYAGRLKEIREWNQAKKGSLRGISVVATKFGIAFTARFMNQANALVNLHLDGTVQVSTGATEMGQGVNTKIRQTVAHAFSIPYQNVEVMPTSTEKNHNTSPTAGSTGSDLNCSAAWRACEAILTRLKWLSHLHFEGAVFDSVKECPPVNPSVDLSHIDFKGGFVFDRRPSLTSSESKKLAFQELVRLAYFNRISLSEYAHFRTDGLGYDRKTGRGTPYKYFVQGVGVSEVWIDEYTGHTKLSRSDLLIDLGTPIHPGIDLGQVTGAFIQGVGWLTTEKLVYDQKGGLLSHSPTTYKIPNIQDIPRIFNVQLYPNQEWPEGKPPPSGPFGSRAVGEPPLLLSVSVWTAVKHALSFRINGKNPVPLPCPATGEAILLTLGAEL